jgi:hypothetical protein
MEVQKRITGFITDRFPEQDRLILNKGLNEFQLRSREPIVLWGKRYVLELMKYEFLNYRDGESINTSPEEEVRIFKAYLLVK